MTRLLTVRTAALAAAACLLGVITPNTVRAEKFPPLNPTASAQQIPGKFIWADLFSSEPEAAAAFYSSLFGWTSTSVEKNDKSYIILTNGDHPVAGVVQRPMGATKRASNWISYISVLDANQALAKAKAGGAQERAPVKNFANRGYQAIVTDAEGAPIGLLQSTSGDRPDDEPKAGDWNWFEYFSLKSDASVGFYESTFGLSSRADDRPNKTGHFVLSSLGKARAGIAPLPAGADSRPGWLGFVRVNDVDDAVAKVTTLGGQVLEAPHEAALGSRSAIIADPTGGEIGIVQFTDNNNPANKP